MSRCAVSKKNPNATRQQLVFTMRTRSRSLILQPSSCSKSFVLTYLSSYLAQRRDTRPLKLLGRSLRRWCVLAKRWLESNALQGNKISSDILHDIRDSLDDSENSVNSRSSAGVVGDVLVNLVASCEVFFVRIEVHPRLISQRKRYCLRSLEQSRINSGSQE